MERTVTGVLKKLRGIRALMQIGESKTADPVDILNESYRDLCRLAEQIANHAGKAPYPHMSQRLNRIAQEDRASAALLRDKIPLLGKEAEPHLLDIKSGKNHWQRMVQDLHDHRALETRLSERAALVNEAAPNVAELLQRIVASHRSHTDAFLDLIARADPQAEQT
jgi:hypothetical protein